MRQLLEELVFPALEGRGPGEAAAAPAGARHDGAVLEFDGSRLAFTTDGYVVSPRFFPGGDLGSLAVHGAVNDLAMCGARPMALSLGMVLEEGLPLAELRRLLDSLRRAADAAGVAVVTGDTKVVERGKGDGVFLNVSAVGRVEHALEIGPAAIRPGDAVLLSGDLGRHGIAVLAAREGLAFETEIESDSAPLHGPVLAMLEAGLPLHCLRDLTRGGLASAMKELMLDAGLCARLREAEIAVAPQVHGACEMLGLDPLQVANEGRFVAILPEEAADEALAAMRRFPVSQDALRIGTIEAEPPGRVVLHSPYGTARVLEMPHGEPLPRIC
jgi:hydrogenase expression/formation protein HypE